MSDSKVQRFEKKLQQDFPDLLINSVKILGTGWHHDAVEVNDSIIFRIPHHIYGQDVTPETVYFETEILKILKDKVPVSIPDPQFIAPDKSYFGYPKLNGVLLQDFVKTFNDSDRLQLRKDWVAIASAMHQNVSIEAARALKIPDFEQSGPSAVERIFDMQEITPDIKEFARTMLKQRQEYESKLGPYVFIHNDLQFHNILANPETKRITGLIDWTDACVGPISREFSIDEWMQGNLLDEVAKLYEEKTGTRVNVRQSLMWRSLEELGDYVEETEAGEQDEAIKTLGRIKLLIAAEK